MHEIFFRGKRIDNGEWVYGGFLGLDTDSGSSSYIAKKPTKSNSNFVPVIPESVGQYTGLTDKNGVKIFEGDIVRYGTNTNRAENKNIHEVLYETRGGSGYFGIRISQIETWQFCLEVPSKLMEVIGNIYDTPELLDREERE